MNEEGKEQGTRKTNLPDQKDNRDMYYQEIYSVLERAFQDTFIEELVPGIVHNFANPLNGIMGRSRLLQRKLMDIAKRTDVDKDTSYHEHHEKLVRDVDSIAREADRLSVILQTVTGKLCALGDRTMQKVNLSELIELEMRFFDFYLDFKHSVKKTMQVNKEVPEVIGSPADYSLAISALIRHAMVTMKESVPKELYISTQLENGKIYLQIQNRGAPMSDDLKRLLFDETKGYVPSLEGNRERTLLCAFSLLRKWGASFEIRRHNDLNTIVIVLMPFYQAKTQFGD
jgi:signal transduction histidine kinase